MMRNRVWSLGFWLIISTGAIAGLRNMAPADESVGTAPGSNVNPASPTQSVEQSRRQAEILHTSIHSALRVVHDRYYREDEALPIPAAAMLEVFRDIEAQESVKLRWLAVEGQAMNTDHVAKGPFETEAVRALKAGKPFHEEVSDDQYRRAAPITLSNHCLKCHMPDRKSTKDRIAGLIISVPISR